MGYAGVRYRGRIELNKLISSTGKITVLSWSWQDHGSEEIHTPFQKEWVCNFWNTLLKGLTNVKMWVKF